MRSHDSFLFFSQDCMIILFETGCERINGRHAHAEVALTASTQAGRTQPC